jgi:hypothetical protein
LQHDEDKNNPETPSPKWQSQLDRFGEERFFSLTQRTAKLADGGRVKFSKYRFLSVKFSVCSVKLQLT